MKILPSVPFMQVLARANVEAILLVPMHRKRTLWKLASAIGIPLGTLHWMDEDDNVIAPHTNAVRPYLQDHHQFARV
jgi:hypothetical protein